MPAKILLCSVTVLFYASYALACGVYELNGTVRQNEAGTRVVVAEGTMSETSFTFTRREELKLLPYKDAPIRTSVLILTPFNGTRAKVEKIESVDFRVPDPLRSAADSNYRVKQSLNCDK